MGVGGRKKVRRMRRFFDNKQGASAVEFALIAPFMLLLVCGSAWKMDPVSGVIGVEKGPLIPEV